MDKEYCTYGDKVHSEPTPKIFRDCNGIYMYDSENTPYLDLQMWFAACNLGYKNRRIRDAVVDQLDTLPQISSNFLYDYKVLLSEKIAKANIERFNEKGRVHFNVGGSQATEDALKLIRNYTHKNRMFAFYGAFHGRTLGASCLTAGYRYREPFGHFSDEAHFVPYPYCYRCPYGKHCDSCNYYCVQQLRREFEDNCAGLYDHSTKQAAVGAFFIEPVQGSGGYIVPPKGYFKELKKVLDDFGVLLVDDEIQMGFYRTGKLWAIEHYDVKPDVITFGKSLTNGLNPLGGMWAKEELINPEVWPAGRTHSTFCNNPIGMRAGYEVMNTFEEDDFETSVAQKGKYFLDGLKSLERKHKRIGMVDGLGLALRIECVTDDGYTPDPKLSHDILIEGYKGDLEYQGKKCGLILNKGSHYNNSLTLVPAVTISYDEIDMAIELIDQLFTRLT
ncbi:aminotransferase class III-fold pyridoxal phosphate-dependent enzyme [bacterium]|nr:aminotransferase class III-fold pyridoxal phosphate-dependent enzyme [bacterium]